MTYTITGTCELISVDKREYEALKRLEALWKAWKIGEESDETLAEWKPCTP